MGIFEFEGKKPVVPESCYVDDTATIIGLVEIGEECYIGPGARIKGDYGLVRLGDACSVQENCVIHARPDCETTIGSRVTIGHGAILHGPVIGNDVIIGMGAIVSDDANIGDTSIVAEGSVVPNGAKVPPRSVVMGVPGKVRGDLMNEKNEAWIQTSADIYIGICKRYKADKREISREEAAKPRPR